MTLNFQLSREHTALSLTQYFSVVAGYTGRDQASVQHHIDELAAIGVAPPPEVPMFYPVDPATVSCQTEFLDDATHLTSGEVEPVYIRHRGIYYLGLGSDHTDRDLERDDIGASKRACPKPVGNTLIRIGTPEQLRTFSLDHATASCTVDGTLYQQGTLNTLRTPYDIVTRLIHRFTLSADSDFVCFGGTLPVIGGTFTAGHQWQLHLEISADDTLSHRYQMKGSR